MAYTLYGSLTSPYVRRLRLYMRDVPYTFEVLNWTDPIDDARLAQLNPIRRIPVLTVDGRPLWESRVIFGYIQKAHGRPSLSFAEENLVSAIDSWQDQLIQPFLIQRAGHPLDWHNGYYKRYTERQHDIMKYLASAVAKGEFSRWDYPAMSLYCLLDWAFFRSVLSEAALVPALRGFYESAAVQPSVAATDPRTP